MANNRGGLSKREFEARSKGQPMPYASKPKVSAVKASGSSSGNSKMTSQLKAAQKALEQSYKPTGEETAAENAVNDLATQSIASVNKIKAEPIAQGFQTGQIRETERRSEEKAVPLKLQIATLQARRQASSNLASSKLQYAKDMIAQSQKSTSTSLSQDEEYKQLQKDKLKASIAKTNKPKATESTTNDWQKVTMEKGPTGRVRSIIERNKKTGETRRVNVK